MYHINRTKYNLLADEIRSSLTDISYFSGTVSLDAPDGGAQIEFTASLVIYRRKVSVLSDEKDDIVDVVPVWWECRTWFDDREVQNDFDFGHLRRCLLD